MENLIAFHLVLENTRHCLHRFESNHSTISSTSSFMHHFDSKKNLTQINFTTDFTRIQISRLTSRKIPRIPKPENLEMFKFCCRCAGKASISIKVFSKKYGADISRKVIYEQQQELLPQHET